MVYETFSRRRRKERGERIDVFQYESVPENVRVQILQILAAPIESYRAHTGSDGWGTLKGMMRREKGVFELYPGANQMESDWEIKKWFLKEGEIDVILDFVQLSFQILKFISEGGYAVPKELAEPAIDEINFRLREAGIGFEFKEEILIEISSEFIHSEAVLPALTLLHDQKYAAADAEFREAHSDFRADDYEGTVVECGKALESVLKVICDKRGWEFDPKDNAKKLLDTVFENGLIPEYLAGNFKCLRALLESGIPAIRNKEGGHGAGASKREVPRHLAAFQLHQTAAVILMLTDAEAALA